MATTAIWAIKGSIANVVKYVENPDKTANPEFVPQMIAEAMENEQALRDVISYATRDEKTDRSHYVTGLNCGPDTAREDMMETKQRYGKLGGNVAYHGYQSFAPGEVTPDLAHEIGIKLAQELWGDRFEIIVATHLDKAHHIHNHFLLNSVSFADGGKYNDCKETYRLMRATSDRLCREHRLSVIRDPAPGRAKHYGEWNAERQGRPTWRGMVKADMDAAIAAAQTDRQFFDLLRKKGYAIKQGKDISVRPPGKERFVRLMRNFGPEYSLEGIKKRILDNRMKIPVPPKKPPPLVVLRCHMRGPISRTRKITGWRALYFQYLYKMGILPHKKTPYQKHLNRKVHFLLREDIIKLKQFDEETRLLWREKIDTPEQLLSFQETASKKEAKICERIITRTPVMREKLNTVRKEEKIRKEHLIHEHIRRRSGTNRAVFDGRH